MIIDHDCSLYHHEHGELALSAGDKHPGAGWHDNPKDAGLTNIGTMGPVWAKVGEPVPSGPVEISDEWQSMHWKGKVALAKRLGHDVQTQEQAVAAISAELAKRAG